MRASDISCQMPLESIAELFVPSASIHHRACVKTYCPRIVEIVVNSTVTLLRVHIEGEWKYRRDRASASKDSNVIRRCFHLRTCMRSSHSPLCILRVRFLDNRIAWRHLAVPSFEKPAASLG